MTDINAGTDTAGTESYNTRNRTVAALFDRHEDAERAIEALTGAGIDRSDIHVSQSNQSSLGGSTGTTSGSAGITSGTAGSGHGLFQSLKNAFLPERESHAYAEGVRRGGTLVAVRTHEGLVDRVIETLERFNPSDIEGKQAEWRSSGWQSYDETRGTRTAGQQVNDAMPSTASGLETARSGRSDTASGLETAREGSDLTASGLQTARTDAERTAYDRTSYNQPAGDRLSGQTISGETDLTRRETLNRGDLNRDETIPVIEEELRIGKREVERGSVRVHSYIVETPVEEQVTLRDETIQIERRPVDRDMTGTIGEDAFRERTIEVVETDEEAVVQKTARIREEVAIRKDVTERTETVSDTVRRTEVEVDDERTDRTAATPTRRAAE